VVSMDPSTALLWMVRVAGAYYFAGFLYNLGLLYEYRLWRGIKLEKEYLHIDDFDREPKQTKIAVIIPAFREENVLKRTLRLLVEAAEKYDPRLVKIFVGTYPNDPGTRRIAKSFEAEYPGLVEEVVNPKPGPTTKAQNLNNVYEEVRRGSFDLVGIQDAEDITPQSIFKAVNYWYKRIRGDERFAGLQLAVRAKPDNYSYTNLVYLLMLRSTNLFLTARNGFFIPSHGAGTYYKREAVDEVLSRKGYVWDEDSFTEDFELSLYLYYVLGKTLLYIPYPYIEEYFPSTFRGAVKQMSRWSYGALQSLAKHSLNIVRNPRNLTDPVYTAGFGLWPISALWLLGTLYILYRPCIHIGICGSLSTSPVEDMIYLVNTINGFRYILESIIFYEGLKLSKAGENVLRRASKDILIAFYTSILGVSTSIYMVYRYLLKRSRVWVKTDHK